MKRWLFLTALLLALTGCTAEPEQTLPTPTEVLLPATEPATQPATEPTGYYDPDSTLEASTAGAVRVYPLNRSSSYALYTMGDDLLLLSGTEATTMTRLAGNSLYVAAAANLDCFIPEDSPALQVSSKGVTYYDEAKNQLVFLDTGLKEGNRVDLPAGIVGPPALSADRKQLYYLTGEALHCIDLETGLDRFLKEITFPQQTLTGLHCNDTILECSVTDSYGNTYGIYISTQNGELLWETLDNDVTLWTHGDAYFAIHYDGEYRELLTGSADQEPMLLNGAYEAEIHPLPDMASAVLVSAGTDTVTLNCYDLETGLRPYSLQLPGLAAVQNLQYDAAETCIWFLRYDETYACDIVCRWDFSQTATNDDTGHLSQRYSAQNPDTAALDACQETANSIAKKHNVEILLWSSAVSNQPQGYSLYPEYQAPLISHCLQRLDQALSNYPSGFLKKAASGTADEKIRICLVREIAGNLSMGTPEYSTGLQFWNSEGNAYIVLTPGAELEQSLYREMTHIIESRVMSTCSAFDGWETLNPDSFDYTYSLIILPQGQEALLEGENRTFIDLHAMTFPREDRARIMEYAMMPGNEAIFESPAMQAKLSRICRGIRKAFKLEKSKDTFLWEQYLQ